MSTYTYLIAGGGTTAGYAAKSLVEQGVEKGEVAIVSGESTLPVDRPPLSKGFLAGDKQEEDVLVNPAAFYNDNGIDVHLDTTISRVDVDARRVEVERGGTFEFKKLLVATGARPRRLDVQGAEEAPVHYLRSVADAKTIRDAGRSAEAPVVIGGGFIGLEVAAALAARGKRVRVLHEGAHVLPHVFTPEVATFFQAYYEERNVEIVHETSVVGFEQTDAGARVLLSSKDALATDFIVAGVGVQPNIELFDGTALEVDDGVVVNEYLETNVPDIYAAGDVARYQDTLFERRLRVEHWQNAHDQGQLAGRNMTGQRQPYDAVPYFFSDMFDLAWEFWGDPEGADEALHVGDVEHGSFSVWWVRDERVVATFVLNRIDEERQRAQASVREARALPRDIRQRGDTATTT